MLIGCEQMGKQPTNGKKQISTGMVEMCGCGEEKWELQLENWVPLKPDGLLHMSHSNVHLMAS